MLDLEISGEPQGKGRLRHRVVRSKANPMGYASGYTPANTVKYQDMIATAARLAYRGSPIDGPVSLHVIAFMKIPQSFSRTKRAAAMRGDLRPVKKPDWDNFGKVASDALNKIVFQDDAQVADASVRKFYSDNPRMRIIVQSSKVVSHASPADSTASSRDQSGPATGPRSDGVQVAV